MPKPVRYFNVSEAQDYLKDEWRWFAKWVLNREPRKRALPLDLGRAVHRTLEVFYRGNGETPMELLCAQEVLAIRARGRVNDYAHWLKVEKEFLKLHYHLCNLPALSEVKGWRTLEIEEEFQETIGIINGTEWVFRGRPDRVIIDPDNSIWHVQYKTLGANKPLNVFIEKVRRSFHEGSYGHHLQHKYIDVGTYRGTMLDVIRKESRYRKDGSERPLPELVSEHRVAITQLDRAIAHQRLSLIARRMAASEAVGLEHGIHALIDNPTLDAGPYDNSWDPYVDAIRDPRRLMDPVVFQMRVDTYENDGGTE